MIITVEPVNMNVTLADRNLKRTEKHILSLTAQAMTADVVINGTKAVHHEGGYGAFRADITQYLKDENKLEVYVDNSDNTKVYPQKADFTFYGGLYRMVNL